MSPNILFQCSPTNNQFENIFTESITRHGFWSTISFEEILKQIHGFAVSVFRPLV